MFCAIQKIKETNLFHKIFEFLPLTFLLLQKSNKKGAPKSITPDFGKEP